MPDADASKQPLPDDEIEIGSPWHFKLLLIALVLYLIYRGAQLLIWGYHQLF